MKRQIIQWFGIGGIVMCLVAGMISFGININQAVQILTYQARVYVLEDLVQRTEPLFCETVAVAGGALQEVEISDMTLGFIEGGPELTNTDLSLRVWVTADQLPEGARAGNIYTVTMKYTDYGYACAGGGFNYIMPDTITFHEN